MRSSIEAAIPAIGRGELTIVTDDERRENDVERVRLMTNNLARCRGLEGFGLEIVERVALPPRRTEHNVAYLATKRARMGHLLDGAEATVR